MRDFGTGATRNDSGDKFDYEAFLSPNALTAYGNYMHAHRKQSDGTLRDGDNWQSGIPLAVYMKSLVRHTFDLWSVWRGNKRTCPDDGHLLAPPELCCAIMFNVMGFLHEFLKQNEEAKDGS